MIFEADELDRLRRARRPRGRPRAAARDALQRGAATSFASAGRPAPTLGGTVDVRPVGVEQSNTSIVFGDELIMKAFRKVEPGVNPELELLRFLSARGFPHIALAGRLVRGRGPPHQRDARDPAGVPGRRPRRLGAGAGRARRAIPNGLLDRIEALGVVIGELHTALGSRQLRPGVRARRAVDRGALDPHRRRRRADRARLPRPARDRRGRADPRPRPGRAREAQRALARRRRRARDPHPRRPAPRPDDAHRARLGGARLRGRAGAAAARAAAEALAAARRRRDAALVLLRDGGREAAARRRGARRLGGARARALPRAGTTAPWTAACCRPASRPPSSCSRSSSSRRPYTSCATS